MVITVDDIGRLADAAEIGRRTLGIARQGILVGLRLSGAMPVVAAFGVIPPPLGVVSHNARRGRDPQCLAGALR